MGRVGDWKRFMKDLPVVNLFRPLGLKIYLEGVVALMRRRV